jgi:glutathione S-transferase
MDGLHFAFPRLLGSFQKANKYSALFEHHAHVKTEHRIKEYLTSERRRPFGMGLFRHYPELDEEAEEK